ncbi:MAG: hypothetical protein F9K49_03780, partial [Caedimonadaceae bacterium]
MKKQVIKKLNSEIKVKMTKNEDVSLEIEFENNKLLPLLFGERDRFLRHIEKTLGVTVVARGNHVLISGSMH